MTYKYESEYTPGNKLVFKICVVLNFDGSQLSHMKHSFLCTTTATHFLTCMQFAHFEYHFMIQFQINYSLYSIYQLLEIRC